MADNKIDMIGSMGLHPYQQAKLEMVEANAARAKKGLAAEGAGKSAPCAKRQEEIRQAATQFEAMLLQQMLKSMWATVPNDGIFGGSREEEYYRDMLTEGLAETIAEQQGIGIRDVIIRDIERLENRELVKK